MRVCASSLLLVELMPPAAPALSSKTLAAPRRSTTSAQEAVSLAFVFNYVAILTTGHVTAVLEQVRHASLGRRGGLLRLVRGRLPLCGVDLPQRKPQ